MLLHMTYMELPVAIYMGGAGGFVCSKHVTPNYLNVNQQADWSIRHAMLDDVMN